MPEYAVSAKVAAAAADVLNLMTTAEYAKEEALMDGAVKALAKVQEKTETKVVIVVERDDPSRGPGGKMSNKTEKNIITQEWYLASLTCKWKCIVPGMEKLVKISGKTWLESRGDSACELKESGSVDIKAPVVGKIIANGVVSDIKKNFSKKSVFIEKKLS